ncbi:MAG TPA: type I polyketide synthase, partial [Candidatus Angelobacter sp.]|nr:type I polyketide synthase [Candidatus Angelobacter sp.]
MGALLEDPQGEGLTLTGRLSLSTHPWLADHAVAGSVLLPGTAFVELALRAGEQAGAQSVEELTIAAPLLIPEQGAIALQVTVAGEDEEGRRELTIHSRPEGEGEWEQNASGMLAPQAPPSAEPLGPWPPEGAEPIEVDSLYERLAEAGLEYGAAFAGLSAAWRAGEETYAEVSLPTEHSHEAQRFALHPALLDAALHAIALSAGSEIEPRLPFSWSEVSLHGAGASELRVKLSPEGAEKVSLSLFDPAGAPLGRVGSLSVRALDPSQLKTPGKGKEGLLAIEWAELAPAETVPYGEVGELFELIEARDAEPPEVALWQPTPPEQEENPALTARAFAEQTLAQIQAWLGAEHLTDTRLAILAQGAVASAEGESPDLAAATLWGLIRSAQSEHPERFVLIDSDGSKASQEAIGAALSLPEEPQLAIREGRLLGPRATPLAAPEQGQSPLDPEKTVLITGATGGLGSLLAHHLVKAHGARHLLLISRSAAKAKGAKELVAELEALGAKAKLSACDVSDRAQLQKLLGGLPKSHPLGAVIHAAGVLDDATLTSLSPEQIERVFAPKADAAWHLHELTKETELSAFVCFSSAAGALGAPGQANYAAANSFLDALAQSRAAEDLPASSIAWGLWQHQSAMSEGLGEAELARLARAGIAALSDEQGLLLFDRALFGAPPATLALGLDAKGLRAQAQAGELPALLSSLVRVPLRRRSAGSSLAARLATVPEPERSNLVLELVRSEVAAVLGHGSAAAIEPTRAFKELGFDSLAAVELRNRLRAATGLRLAATVVFDYPSSASLAERL